MLALNKKFNDARAIKVLVVPIGDNSLFDRQFEIVSKHRSVPMYELNRPSSDVRTPNTPFKNLNWDSGTLLFDYLRYDRVSSGQGDLETFQCNRRYLHVIGLINYPELEGSKYRLEEDMDYYTRRYPNVILRRYFVFNMFNHPSSNSWTIPSIPGDPNAIVVFPPDGECEGGNSMVEIHLQEVMAGVALRVLLALEAQAAVCDDSRLRAAQGRVPPGMNLFTSYDEMEEGAADGGGAGSITFSNASSKMKKRIGGRLRKITADLCLQACSPLDALEHYIAAVADCKSQGDSMWLAGAYEGFATSLLWCIDMRLAVEEAVGRDLRGLLQSGMSLSCAAIKLAEDRGVEALGLYARNITFAGLEVECSLKLARMYEEAATAGVPDREQKVMEFLLRAVSVPGLNRQQQMECTLEAAFICSRMRLHRKYAFFLFLAALFANDSENAVVTHFMMKCALQKYGINFKEDEVQAILHSSVDVSDNAGAHASFAHSAEQQLHAKEDGHTVGRGLSWASMRRVLYAQCAHFAREAGDSTSAARCMAGMLRLLAEADVQWRQSTANWLPRNFKPTDLKKLLLTCNNINLSALSAGVSPMGSSPDLSNQSASKSGIPLTINVRFASERSLPSSTDHLSPVNAKSPVNARSPVISSLNSSHSMAQFRNIYSKGNYQRLHAKMRNAGGRIADLQENLASMIEKNQVFEFSFNGNDEREMSDTLSEVGSVRGGFVPAFLSEGSLNKVSNLKRKVAVPKLDGFVASLTFRPSAASTPKLLPRSASIASVGGASNVGIAFDNHANDQASIHGSVGGGDGASVLNANYNASMGGSIFSLGNAVATPSNITSQLLGSPDIASAAMISAGLVDENGMPNVGALTPSSNCIIRSWLGSGGGGSSAGFEKLRPLQEGCIRRLEMFCEDVPPSCPIYLGESPLLISMTPQALPDNSRPFPTPRQKIVAGVLVKDDEKSALYYDPFMAKRDKRLKESSKKPEEIIWVQGMVSKVLVCFSNSLSAPIRMCNVAVILQEVEETSTGKCYEITPENIEIPSVIEGGASYQTVLSIMPIKVYENGFGMSKSKEILSPWRYPRQARDIKSGISDNQNESQRTSMVIQVVEDAAPICLKLSWPQRDAQGAELTLTPTEPALVSELSICDGESRRETIVLKNMSNSELEDIRLTLMFNPQGSVEKSKGLFMSREILLPWRGSLEDTQAEGVQAMESTGKRISARAAAAISDYKNYIAEKEKERLGEEGPVVPVIDPDSETDDFNEETVEIPPLVKVVLVEAVDDAGYQGPLVLPIPAYGSVRITLEFSFREDLLLGPAPSMATVPCGTMLSFGMSYLTSNKSNSDVLYYRNFAFETILNPLLGISLQNLCISCPGSYCVDARTESIEPGKEFDPKWRLAVDEAGSGPDGSIDVGLGDDGVVEHLASLLCDNEDTKSLSKTSVQVIGDNWYLVMQWRNQCCEVGAVYSASQNDSSCTEFSENIIANIKETQCRQNTDYCFEENTFFDMTVTTQPSVVIVLPPNSSKSIFVKLVTVKEARMSKSSKRLLLLQIRQRFKSLRWCLLGRHGLRLGYISKNFLSNKAMSKLSDALISPTVEFVSESINLVPQSQNADIAAMAQKTYQLSLPTGYIDSSINATVFASFRLSSVPINTRTFYNFVMKVRFGEHKQSTLGSTRYLELATIVFEGHHVGVTQLGPGVGSAAGTRLGANYILPVISVDHIPATVAATSSSAIGDGKSIALLEVGVPHHIQDGAQKRCGNLATIQVSESLAGPIQSHMACAGVLISGQLRRVFDVSNSSNQHSVVEHAVKLCFTNSGKYTIYILARELQPAHFKSSSITDLSENCRWLASPWLLDSSPVLLSVGGQK